MSEEKKYVPGTNPAWWRELPDGYSNSMVDKAGNVYDNGWNFDENDDEDEDGGKQNGWDEIAEKA